MMQRVMGGIRLGRALQFVWESGRAWVIVNVVLVVLQSTLPLAILYVLKLLVDLVSELLAQPDPTQGLSQVFWIIAGGAAVMLLIVLVRTVSNFVREGLAQVVTDHMHDVIHAKSIEVDLEYYENPQYHNTLHRAQQEASFRPINIVNRLLDVATSGISLLAVAGLLLTLHWGVALVLMVSVLPGLLVRLKFSEEIFRWQRQRTETERQTKYYDMMLTDVQHAKEIRLFNLGDLFLNRFHVLRDKLRFERMEIIKRRSTAELATGAGTVIIENLAYGFMAYQALQGSITIGSFVLYLEGFRFGQSALYSLLYSVADLYEDNLFLYNLYEFLDLKRKLVEPTKPVPMPEAPQVGFEVRNMSFQYPALTRPALKNINLTIRPGEVVALVGENGSGKTTLTKLLCRLYDPTEGCITLDGVDLREYDPVKLRSQFSVLFQDYIHYNLTVSENIWLGDIHTEPDGEKITHAAERSGMDKVIKTLPNAYETILGKWFDEGEELSIGEWQKFALSRAYWRDAPFLILDEPTSAMDPRSEDEVFKNFRELIRGKTAIMISHRLSTVTMADRIYVMEQGEIVEFGTHEELMARGARYAELFELQAEHYR